MVHEAEHGGVRGQPVARVFEDGGWGFGGAALD